MKGCPFYRLTLHTHIHGERKATTHTVISKKHPYYVVKSGVHKRNGGSTGRPVPVQSGTTSGIGSSRTVDRARDDDKLSPPRTACCDTSCLSRTQAPQRPKPSHRVAVSKSNHRRDRTVLSGRCLSMARRRSNLPTDDLLVIMTMTAQWSGSCPA